MATGIGLHYPHHYTNLTLAGQRPRARTFGYTRRRLFNGAALGGGDVVALSVSLLIVAGGQAIMVGSSTLPVWTWCIIPIWLAGAAISNLLPSWGLGPVEELRRYTTVLGLAFAVTLGLLIIDGHTGPAIISLTASVVLGLVLLPFIRLHIKRWLINVRRWGVPTVIFGGGPIGIEVFSLLNREQGLGYQPVGLVDLYSDTSSHADLCSSPAAAQAPVAIIITRDLGRERALELLEGPLAGYRAVLVIPDLFDAPSLWIRPRDLNGVLGLEIRHNLSSPAARLLKRVTDIVVVLAAAPIWVPLCALLAFLTWLPSRENPLFIQERVGLNGRPFQTLKLRTMVADAENVLRRKLQEDPALLHEWNTSYKLKNDPRITRLGAILRRLSLDELPQLINVLAGDMSLVGPRPLPCYHHEDLSSRARGLRARVRPGITGLWQVSGRSDAGTSGMELWDPYYVRNWSLWLDAVVLTRTVRAVVRRTGAY